MKLDDAYNAWGQQSDNRELFQKTKTTFRKMWWLIPTNKPCSYYTLQVLGRALAQANGAHGDKVSAASVMCHVLNYAYQCDPEGWDKPRFGFSDIVNYEGTKPSPMVQTIEKHETESARGQVPGIERPNDDEPLVKVKPAAKAAIKREKNDAGIGSSEREQARRDNGKAVVQLDADTLKPIKVWKSCHAPQTELGIRNVQRAVERHGLAGGYYWCRPGDEESFKPADKRSNNGGKKAAKPKSATYKLTPITSEPKPLTKEQKELYSKVFGDARGQSPDRKPVKVQSPGIERPNSERLPTPEQQEQLKEAEVQHVFSSPERLQEARQEFQQAVGEHVEGVLQKCTQDEIIAELRRRHWRGTLHITQTIEL